MQSQPVAATRYTHRSHYIVVASSTLLKNKYSVYVFLSLARQVNDKLSWHYTYITKKPCRCPV